MRKPLLFIAAAALAASLSPLTTTSASAAVVHSDTVVDAASDVAVTARPAASGTAGALGSVDLLSLDVQAKRASGRPVYFQVTAKTAAAPTKKATKAGFARVFSMKARVESPRKIESRSITTSGSSILVDGEKCTNGGAGVKVNGTTVTFSIPTGCLVGPFPATKKVSAAFDMVAGLRLKSKPQANDRTSRTAQVFSL